MAAGRIAAGHCPRRSGDRTRLIGQLNSFFCMSRALRFRTEPGDVRACFAVSGRRDGEKGADFIKVDSR